MLVKSLLGGLSLGLLLAMPAAWGAGSRPAPLAGTSDANSSTGRQDAAASLTYASPECAAAGLSGPQGSRRPRDLGLERRQAPRDLEQ